MANFQRGNVFASRNLHEANRGVLRLYRRALKGVPTMVRTYRLPYEVQEIRRLIRVDFESHSHTNDAALVDLLVMKGENQLEEVEQNWATKAHVLHYLFETEQKEAELKALPGSEGSLLFDEPAGSIDSWKKFVE